MKSGWSVTDREGIAIAMAMGNAPQAVMMGLQKELEKDSPVIVWDFHSLLVMMQMCFSFMLTDRDSDMRMCKHCKKAFIASRRGNEFCSQRCKNQYNVYKSSDKKRGNK